MIDLDSGIGLGGYLKVAGIYLKRACWGGASREQLEDEHSDKENVRYGLHCYTKVKGEWYELIPPEKGYGTGKFEKM